MFRISAISAVAMIFFILNAREQKEELKKVVSISCNKTEVCALSLANLFSTSRQYNLFEINGKIRQFISSEMAIEKFNYAIFSSDTRYNIEFNYQQKKQINNITFEGDFAFDVVELKNLLPFKEGDRFIDNEDYKKTTIEMIAKHLRELRGNNYEVFCKTTILDENKINLDYKITQINEVKISTIIMTADSEINLSMIKNSFLKFKHKAWDQIEIDTTISQITKELFEQGYYDIKITATQVPESNMNAVKLLLSVHFGNKIILSFRGNKKFSRQEITAHLHRAMISNQLSFSEHNLKNEIINLYESVGIYNTEITFSTLDEKDRKGSSTRSIYFQIRDGHNIELMHISFRGNEKLPVKILNDAYLLSGTDLSKAQKLDKKFLKDFSAIIKNEYLKNGYITAEVSTPSIFIFDNTRKATVEFVISEGEQTVVSEINLLNINPKLTSKVLTAITNKKGRPLDASAVISDSVFALEILKNRGHIFAKLSDIDKKTLIVYSSDYLSATINYDFKLGKLAKFHGIKVTGLQKTKPIIIERAVSLERNETITATKLEILKNRLLALGIFSQVTINSEVVKETEDKAYVILSIIVRENDSIVVELAPGFRTDIGYKLSTAFLINNVNGLNRSLALRSQINRRIDLTDLHPDRQRGENKNLLEYDIDLSFNEPYFFLKDLNFQTEFSTSRKRIFAFDADIRKISTSFSKTFFQAIDLGIRYQLEDISQFNGVDSPDNNNNDYYRIGGIIPSIALDLRDDKIRTKKGAYLGLSVEISNSGFGSLNKEDLIISFIKIVSRNKFYFPIGDWIIASSFSFGREENLEKDRSKSYIPSIKVFRMDGVDLVRGFSSSEINKLPDGRDISETKIIDRAYFTNYKIEPRYALSDTTLFAFFLDAGQVYLNQFDPLSVRISSGISLKFITPVGTLDFDYGIKLNRRLDHNFSENFGRFHISIGFF